MDQQPAAEETEMDTTANAARLMAACDTDANVAAAAQRTALRTRLERASRPSRRIVEMLPVD